MRAVHVTSRPAFTLIEVIVSVVIISVVVISVYKISSRDTDTALYLSKRYRYALEDSLYLQKSILKYHKDERSAYELLSQEFQLKEDKSREALKKSSRDIFIDQRVKLFTPEQSVEATLESIYLKKAYSSRYNRFREIKGIK
jgi:prepilin-type N-terminal cleavage/methylation domain-containing protein